MICAVQPMKFRARLHLQGLKLHLDGLMVLTLTGDAEKRQATFLGVIRAVILDDLGIAHNHVRKNSSVLVEKCECIPAHTIISAAISTQQYSFAAVHNNHTFVVTTGNIESTIS